jgi:LysM repeat protein
VWQIARNYGVSPYDILAANGMSVATGSTIYAGTVLCIPERVGAFGDCACGCTKFVASFEACLVVPKRLSLGLPAL